MNKVYYHNPKCSKSRKGLEFLTNKGVHFTVKEYLKEKLSTRELTLLFENLHGPLLSAIRDKETLYKELNLSSKSLKTQEWIDILQKNPILLERPILVTDSQTLIGRPTENFENLKGLK